MAYLWEVEHTFEQGLPVANIVDSYPSLNVNLKYTDSKLVVINHKLETDGSEACNIIELSKNKLQVFFAYLQFDYGPSLPPIKSKIKKNPENLHERLTSCNSVSLDCGICRTIRLPDNTFFSEIDYRKYILLLLANKAQEMKEPEYAIKNYYIILEELYPDKVDYEKNIDRVEIKYVRNFVSHSMIDKDKKALKFLANELNEEVCDSLRYDPLNSKHKELVNKYKNIGFRLIDEEFNKIINNP
jgi:hypothetical protein